MTLDVLAIAAHPDDVELSCAGTLMLEKQQGKRVGIVDLTRGELGTRGTPEQRAREAQDALKIMGLDVRLNAGLADGFFQNTEADQRRVVQFIRHFRPTVVLTNAPEDRHPDHGRAAALVRDAAFLSGLRRVETSWEGAPQEAWRPANVFHFIQDRFLKPDFVYDITAVMEQKIKAIRAFTTQFDTAEDDEPQTYISTPEFLETIIGRAKQFGKMIGVAYGEGYITEKTPGITSLDALIHRVT